MILGIISEAHPSLSGYTCNFPHGLFHVPAEEVKAEEFLHAYLRSKPYIPHLIAVFFSVLSFPSGTALILCGLGTPLL